MMHNVLVKSLLPLIFLTAPFFIFYSTEIEQAAAAAVFTAIILLWFSEALPLPVTGLLVPVLAILSGVLTVPEAFGAFGNQILFLFIGSFLLARSMQKHGWDTRMAYLVLSSRFGSRSLRSLVAVIACICWTLSMWISNTATCAMMAPLCLGIVRTLRNQFTSHQAYTRFNARLLLTCAFASSIGGMATPVGSPPNLLALQFLAERGISVSFLSWMLCAVPLSVVMLLVVLYLLERMFSVPPLNLRAVQLEFAGKLKELGPVKRPELLTAICFFVAIIFWVLPDVLVQLTASDWALIIKDRMPMGLVALLAGSLLFVFHYTDENSETQPCLNWTDAGSIDWGTVMLFGGGLCLGLVLSNSGLAAELGNWLLPENANSALLPLLVVLCIGVLLSEFGSNTASASILIPVVLATSYGAADSDALQFVLGVAFATSFGFMLPVSTPPNAIVYGTGELKLKDMIRAGIIFDLLGILFIFVYLGLLLPTSVFSR